MVILSLYMYCVSPVSCANIVFMHMHINSAQLLRDRKQNPTPKWLKELPYKARKLEEQLYKTAPSLQAYLDKATVKHRLKKVAHAITSQFRIAKGKSPSSGKRTSKKSSDISLGSILSAMSPRNSNTSASGDMSDLERQQQVNQKLQDQILENIRQQQQIMRNLMGSNSNNNNNQQGGNQQHSASDQMMAATMASQANQMTEQMGAAQMASQMSSQMGGMSNAMGMSAASLNTSGYNATAGMNSGGYNSLGLSAASLANMNAAGLNPLLVQQLMQQRMAATQSPAAVQMAMMNLRNSLSGQTNPAAMNPAAHMGESMSSVIPAPPLTSTSSAGINPTMPPPNMNAAMRSSFTSGSGYEDGGGGTGHTDLSLSPNSFKW